jgi:hypothetical protein
VGVVFALDALAIPVSVVVFIGLILLAGIVVANAIVLIDRVNQTRAGGLPVREAILESGATRLRPIYMTANTTVIGLLPMTGWLVWIPYIGGLGWPGRRAARADGDHGRRRPDSTVLTLVVIPTVYWLSMRARAGRAHELARATRASSPRWCRLVMLTLCLTLVVIGMRPGRASVQMMPDGIVRRACRSSCRTSAPARRKRGQSRASRASCARSRASATSTPTCARTRSACSSSSRPRPT